MILKKPIILKNSMRSIADLKSFCIKQKRNTGKTILKHQLYNLNLKLYNVITVISFDVKSSSMIKQQVIMTIIVTSVLALGAIGFISFANGQSNDSSDQTSNQTNTEGASGSASVVKMQINDAIKSLESNDNSGALMH